MSTRTDKSTADYKQRGRSPNIAWRLSEDSWEGPWNRRPVAGPEVVSSSHAGDQNTEEKDRDTRDLQVEPHEIVVFIDPK